MTPGPLDTLRRAFVGGGEPLVAGSTCPSAAEIWDAAHAELDPARAREIVRHVATCAACAADWHLAMRGGERPAVAADLRPPRSSAVARWVRLAGAAAVLAGIGWLGLQGVRERETPPVFREGAGAAEIRALVPEDRPLARDGALLRWSALGEGARYTVELSAEDLTPLHTAHGLAASELEVPPEVLSRVGPGEAIVWRVEARLPDGTRVSSGAFVHRLE